MSVLNKVLWITECLSVLTEGESQFDALIHRYSVWDMCVLLSVLFVPMGYGLCTDIVHELVAGNPRALCDMMRGTYVRSEGLVIIVSWTGVTVL